MRPTRLFFAATLLVTALSAQGGVRAVLHSPRAGDVLRGGERATIAWSASDLPAFVEEWEAFLSVDGGRYYAYRITPHLELDRREFTFEVPNVETEKARILLRAGDERREIELELPQTFAIRPDRALAMAEEDRELIEEERGEAAREGDRGVVEWVDGERDGTGLVERDAFDRRLTITRPHSRETNPQLTAATSAPSGSFARGPASTLDLVPASAAARPAPASRDGRAVLLACRRLNL